MRFVRGRGVVVAVLALFVALAVISPALGGPSLKKLIRKEVAKQLRNKQGPAGQPGTSFDANATLPSGQTLTGVWILTVGAGNVGTELIPFVPHLSADLDAASVHRISGPPTTVCPGPGTAAAGHFCLYERSSTISSFSGIANPATGGLGADRRGAQVGYTGPTGSAAGTWAVTP